MTEAEFRAEVVKRIYKTPGLVYHYCRNGRACDGHRGLPDLIIAGPRGIILRELKSEDGLTDAGQDLWAWTLAKAAGATHCLAAPRLWAIWRPHDLDNGKISQELVSLT